jgi:hypothetical protein
MQLWTFQPLGFPIDGPDLIVNPKLGSWWNDESRIRAGYQEMLPKLISMLGTDRFLWCCTAYYKWETTPDRPVVEWEVNVPESQVLAYIREPLWDAILKGQGLDLASVIVSGPITPDKEISALVRWPPLVLEGLTCHGKPVDPHWRQEAVMLKTRDLKLQMHFVKYYRSLAADPSNHPIGRKRDAERADYLEEYLGLQP